MRLRALGIAASAVIGLQCVSAHAQTQSADSVAAPPPLALGGDFWTRSKLTGYWSGVRDDWAAQGFTADFDLTYTVQGVATGGISKAGTTPGNATVGDLHFGLDTTKAKLWPGGLFSLRLESRTGDSAFGRAGTISPIDNDAVTPNSPGNLNKNVFGLTEFTYSSSARNSACSADCSTPMRGTLIRLPAIRAATCRFSICRS